MKRVTILIFITIIIVHGLSAQDLKIGDSYIFTSTQGSLQPGERLREGLDQDPQPGVEIYQGHKIQITYLEQGRVYFKYWWFDSTDFQNRYNIDSATDTTRIFSLPKDVFINTASKLYKKHRGFDLEPYTIPLRIRRANGAGENGNDVNEFNGNFSVSANLLYEFGLDLKREYPTIDLSLGFGLTKVGLDRENSILMDANTAFAEVEDLSLSALTLMGGLKVNFSKAVNIGIFTGKDWLSSADQRTGWVFHDKGWLGLGLGVTLGAPTKDSTPKDRDATRGGSQ